jgi:NTE family protein
MATLFHLLRSAAHRAFPAGLGFGRGLAFAGEGIRGPQALELPVRPRVALALSSGAAKGLAHVGVIQVLEEHGIEVDAIAGTSIGAYVGSLHAAGFNGRQLEELALDLETSRDLLRLVDPSFPPRRGFIHGRRIADRLRRSLSNRRIEDLPKPLRVVATELHTFREHVFAEGDVVDAVWASIAIPGICVPVELGGTEYVDGAVANPLPVDHARRLGDIVIAVTVLPMLDDLAKRPRPETFASPQMPPSIWRAAGLWLNQHVNYFAEGNLLDILRQSAFGSQIRLLDRAAAEADVLVRAYREGPGWHDYHHARDYIAAGREAALAALPAVRERIAAFAPTPRAETKRCA